MSLQRFKRQKLGEKLEKRSEVLEVKPLLAVKVEKKTKEQKNGKK